jgi:hypothetical protein
LRLKTFGALGALVALAAVVLAVPASGRSTAEDKSTYILQLIHAPAVAYTGDIAGYAATKPGKGSKFDGS